MNVLELLERAAAWTGSKIAATRPDQMHLPTPCDDWDVQTLIDHIIGTGHRYARIARGEFQPSDNRRPSEPFVGDPMEAYEASIADLLASFREPGALERVVYNPWERAPGAKHASRIAVSHLAHGWDLAKATGQDATMPSDVAEAAMIAIDGRIPDWARGPSGAGYKPVVPTGPDATSQERLIAYLGRQP
jgi:uncharacterized protein (TIGR03086 family)